MDLSGLDRVGKKSFIHNPEKSEALIQHDISSVGFTFKGSFDVNKFGLWMQNYLYSSFMFEMGKPWGDEERYSKLVFIGKQLSGKELEANLLQLMVKDNNF